MKLSLVVLLLAMFTTALAKPNRKSKREFDNNKVKKIEKEIDEEIELGEKLAGDIAGKKHKGEGDVAICALELLEDIGHSFERAFAEKDDHKGEAENFEEFGEFAKKLTKRMFRLKRSAESVEFPEHTFGPTDDGTDGPHPTTPGHPSGHPTGGRKGCNGALEKFFKCMKMHMGELEHKNEHGHEHGHGNEHGHGGEEGTEGWEEGTEGWEEGTEGGSEQGTEGLEEGTEGGSEEGTEGGGEVSTEAVPLPYKRKFIPRRHAKRN